MMKKMTKSQNDRVLTGTLAGIAEYFGIDPTFARVIYVLMSFFLIGSPIILYILLMLVVPNAESTHQNHAAYGYSAGNGGNEF
ncbi:PspC domain-containing protein [Enterococcus hulanensis]|uniref:PspC domain-containing protein n=1 Tax=Enterococcus hulanensis TaxID=2559929 RepID=UPI0010F45D57|nr:PspC domain-containing protein [Enterococcus hulanensis]